jgi:hypothetical protein
MNMQRSQCLTFPLIHGMPLTHNRVKLGDILHCFYIFVYGISCLYKTLFFLDWVSMNMQRSQWLTFPLIHRMPLTHNRVNLGDILHCFYILVYRISCLYTTLVFF